MRLSTVFRPFFDAAAIGGTATDQVRYDHERQVRQARLELARRQSTWVELNHADLVRRGPFLVHAETDQLYIVRRGHVWEPGRAAIGFLPDNTPMTYAVNEADEITFFEQPGSPRTWSEVVARRARRT